VLILKIANLFRPKRAQRQVQMHDAEHVQPVPCTSRQSQQMF